MEFREQGLLVLKQRLKDARQALGLKYFGRIPSKGVDQQQTPAVFMSEGTDRITKYTDRSPLGYPCRRELEVTVDVIVHEDHTEGIRELFRRVRTTVFSSHDVVPKEVFIRELRTIGPYPYNLPGMAGMQLIVGMYYNDDGN